MKKYIQYIKENNSDLISKAIELDDVNLLKN
jgi:hypothetical protein